MTISTANWKTYEFGDLAHNLTTAAKDPLSNGYERYVGLEHIEPGNMHIKAWGNVADGTTFTRIFKAGQVLFGKRRAYQRKSALADFDGVCSGDILVFEANEDNVIPELLPFIVQSDKLFDYAIKTSAGSLSPRTKFKDLAKLKFKLSPLTEQKRLADLLWSVDEVIKSYSRLLSKLVITRNSLFKNNHFDKTKNLQSISAIALINPKVNRNTISKNTHVSFITMADVSEEGRIINKCDRKYSSVQKGFTPFEEKDILFAKITPCMENGKGAVADNLTNGLGFGSTEFHVIRSKNQDDRYYLFCLSRMFHLRKKAEQLMAGSAGQKRVPSDFFDFYKIRFPEKQKRKKLGEQLMKCDVEIENLKKAIALNNDIQKKIINQIFG